MAVPRRLHFEACTHFTLFKQQRAVKLIRLCKEQLLIMSVPGPSQITGFFPHILYICTESGTANHGLSLHMKGLGWELE